MGADAELWTLYQSSTTPETRIEILRALPGRKDNLDKLIEYARSEKDPAVRRELVQQIGIIRSPKSSETLIALYGTETDAKVKGELIDALFVQRDAKALVDIARTEKDTRLRRALIERLSHMKSKEATDYLVELLNK
jgi:HEAT repeat protein